MKKKIEQLLNQKVHTNEFPDFEPGDKVRVTTREEIGGQMRTRRFEGICISRRGTGPNETAKFRKESFGVGVERIYPLQSPMIRSIEIVRKGKVRRAKLNYLEGRSSREARIDEQRIDLEEANRNAEADTDREELNQDGDQPVETDTEEQQPVEEDEPADSDQSDEEQDVDETETEESDEEPQPEEDSVEEEPSVETKPEESVSG